jgi:hypothetical protein
MNNIKSITILFSDNAVATYALTAPDITPGPISTDESTPDNAFLNPPTN